MAALLAAAIGAFSMGLVVVLGEAKLFKAPSLFPPAGGLSGRAAIAMTAWLLSWGVAHRLWSGRRLDSRRVFITSLVLIALALLAVFPPVWGIL